MIKTNFVFNSGFKWFTNNNVSVKGYLFTPDNTFYEKDKLAYLFKNVKTKEQLLEIVQHAKGLFTIFIQKSDSGFILVNDIIRAFPVFFYQNKDDIYLSDDIKFLLDKTEINKIDLIAKTEFVSAGFVSGHNTLINDIQVTQSGEILSFENNKLTIESYFDYSISKPFQQTKEELENQSKQFIDSVFKRLVESLNGRMAVIPLSGGLDSRLIACKLKEYGHKKMLCYTFGRSTNNPEKTTSEKVAKKLGLNWIFIEYNEENIGKYINTEEFKHYYEYYCQHSSSFMFQDYFAIRYLVRNKIIPDDAVFIPGYSGDFLGGSQLYKKGNIKFKASLKQIAENIVIEKYINTDISSVQKKLISEKIELQLKNIYKDKNELLAYSVFENWEIKENLSKFIAQAAHIYNYFGFEYRLPYWDYELVNFYKHVPFKYKYGKKLYDNTLFSSFLEQGVNFNAGKNLNPIQFRLYSIKKKLKKVLQKAINRRIGNQIDYLNYELILIDIVKDLRKDNTFCENNLLTQNSYLAHWYLKQIEKTI